MCPRCQWVRICFKTLPLARAIPHPSRNRIPLQNLFVRPAASSESGDLNLVVRLAPSFRRSFGPAAMPVKSMDDAERCVQAPALAVIPQQHLRVLWARKEVNTEASETLRDLRVELFETQRSRRNSFCLQLSGRAVLNAGTIPGTSEERVAARTFLLRSTHSLVPGFILKALAPDVAPSARGVLG